MVSFSDIKDIASTLNKAGKIKEYQLILELQEQMLNNKEEVSSLKEENKELEEKLKIKGKIEFKDNFYYIDSKGPYCSRCWEKDKNLIRSIPNSINSDNSTCPECKTIANFTGKEKIHKVIQQNVNRFL